VINLIRGRAGSGKSRMVLKMAADAIEEGKRVYLIVPDQATFQTELSLAGALKARGMAGSGVLSFSRLCDRVLGETSGQGRPVLSERGAVMALSMLLMEHKEEFTTFGGYVSSPTFGAMLYEELCELRRFSIRPQDLKKSGSRRAQDIARVMELFFETILSRYTDTVGRMEMMIERIPQAPMLKNSHVIIDGFEMVTDQLLRAVRAIMETAEDVTITFRLGEENDRDFPMFETEYAHYQRMERLALQAGKKINPIGLYEERATPRQQRPMLLHMEKELFSLPFHPYAGEYDDSILVRCGANPRQEAAAAARYAAYLVREKGLRYKDIFIQLCDEAMTGILKEELTAHNIPYFIDEKRPVMEKTVCRFAISLLKCAVMGCRREDVLTMVKTGIYPICEGDAAKLQQYLYEKGVRFISRSAIDRCTDEGLCAILSAIDRSIRTLRAELNTRSAKAAARGFYRALKEFEGEITAYIGALVEDDMEAADEERLAYGALMDILSQMDTMMGGGTLSPREFLQIIEAGLMAEEIAVLPATADCVSVGDMDRSRMASVECLMVLSANDGCLPKVIRPTGILPEREKERMAQDGLWLGNDVAARMAEAEWSIYGAFCKPKSRLYISYSAQDQKGDPRSLSTVIGNLLKVFPKLKIHGTENYRSPMGYAVTAASGAAAGREALMAAARGESVADGFTDLYEICTQALTQGRSSTPMDTLDARYAQALFLPRGTVSATMMERYARCPMAHFVDYGLTPTERKEPGVDPRDRGNLLHTVMERFVERVQKDNLSYHMAEEEAARLARQLMEDAILESELLTDARSQYRKGVLCAQAEEAAFALCHQLKVSAFTPLSQEAFFDAMEEITIPRYEKPIRVVGKIDRVDEAMVQGERYIRVVDYKSGRAGFDEKAIAAGVDLQLPIYASAAAKAADAKIGGMFLMPLGAGKSHRLDGAVLNSTPVVSAMDDTLLETGRSEVIAVEQKKNGEFTARSAVYPEEALTAIVETARAKTAQLVESMVAGRCAPEPSALSDPCRFCPYGGLCRSRGAYKEDEPNEADD